LIFNSKNIEGEEALVEKTAWEIGTDIVYRLPRDPQIQAAEAQGKTVVEAFPDSAMAGHFRALVKKVVNI
jgi:nitrogenase iron protein NifH